MAARSRRITNVPIYSPLLHPPLVDVPELVVARRGLVALHALVEDGGAIEPVDEEVDGVIGDDLLDALVRGPPLVALHRGVRREQQLVDLGVRVAREVRRRLE